MLATMNKPLPAASWCCFLLITLGARAAAAGDQLVDVRTSGGWACKLIQLTPWGDHEKPPVITAVALQPQGRLLAAAGDDHFVRVWNVDTGETVFRLAGHADWVRTLAFSPDGQMLATGGNDRRILFWDMRTGARREPELTREQAIAQVAFSADGRWFGAVGFETALSLYAVGDYKRPRNLACPCHDMRALAFSPDGSKLIAGGRSGVIRAWNCETGEPLADQPAHRRRIRGLLISPDGQRCVSTGEDGIVRVASFGGGDPRPVHLPRLSVKVYALAFVDEGTLAVAGSDNTIRIWDLEGRRELARLEGHQGTVIALDYRDQQLVSGSYDTTVRIWQKPEADLHSVGVPRVGGLPPAAERGFPPRPAAR